MLQPCVVSLCNNEIGNSPGHSILQTFQEIYTFWNAITDTVKLEVVIVICS